MYATYSKAKHYHTLERRKQRGASISSFSIARAIFVLICLVPSVDVLADCVARAYRTNDELPKYEVLGCGPALEHVRGLGEYEPKFESWLSKRSNDDLAVRVKPLNQNARRMMNGRKAEYWHYHGKCDALPKNRPVQMDIKQHCCDTSLYLECFLGDVTIEKAY